VRPHPIFVSSIRMLIGQTRCSYASSRQLPAAVQCKTAQGQSSVVTPRVPLDNDGAVCIGNLCGRYCGRLGDGGCGRRWGSRCGRIACVCVFCVCLCGRVSWVWRSARYARRRSCERPRSGRVSVDHWPYGRVPGVRRGRECGRIASVCTFYQRRLPCVAVCRRITSCGRQRGRCSPRYGFG